MPPSDTTYDIIFAGGGTTACVTAGRLAAADTSLKILILEAGPGTLDVVTHVQPARYYRNLTFKGETFSFHVAKPSESVAGRSVVVPVGRCVGGGSCVNFMMYTRAAASDYDDWESVYDNPGWGSKHLIPLLKKAETFQSDVHKDNTTHGTSGPIKVSLAVEENNLGKQFVAVGEEYDKERGSIADVNDFATCNAYGLWPRYIDIHSGRRSDAAHHYIYNQSHNENLKVLDRSRVVRIIFEGTRAVGVEYVDDNVGRPNTGTPESSIAKASRLVVVSAGAFGSPAILERSGIGGADVLQKNDIHQIVDLPGVGENYMDHNTSGTPYLGGEDAETLEPILLKDGAHLEPHVSQWLETGKGMMAQNGFNGGIKIRPNAEDLKDIGPVFEERWKSYFANAPDKPVSWIGISSAAPIPNHGFAVGCFTDYPMSVGRVHIKSGLDAYAPLDFESGFLDQPADLAVLRWSYKKGRELARRMPSYRGELSMGHPSFAEGSQAASKPSAGPVAISAPNISYSAEDDEAIDIFHREHVQTTWHSLGTCAMKPREQGGVVDSRLNVYGTQNLKVADLSIAPANVGANTYNTAIGIGEKAAVIIAEELGIKGVESA